MDDLNARGSGRRRGDDPVADADVAGSDQDYFWESKPGEDFGPLPSPSGDVAPRGSRPPASAVEETVRIAPRAAPRRPLTPDGDLLDERRSATGQSPRRRRPLLLALGGLLLLVGIVGAAFVALSQQGADLFSVPDADLEPTPALATPTRNSSSATVTIATVVPPAGASPASVPAASPTPLTLTQVTPGVSPVATRSTVTTSASPSAQTSPVAVAPIPALVNPVPGLRFATSTPARLGTPTPPRTPPPVPTARPPAFLNRVWSEQTIYKVGDQATVCGSAASGSAAASLVMGPDRSMKSLGEFQPPTERVCQPMKVDESGLYVLTLVIKDINGGELERQSAALWVGR